MANTTEFPKWAGFDDTEDLSRAPISSPREEHKKTAASVKQQEGRRIGGAQISDASYERATMNGPF